MAIYTVHVPDAAPDAMTRADQTVFLREGFSLAAFIFGLFYLLWHRLWSAAAAWAVLLFVIAAFAHIFHPPLLCGLALFGLMHLYLGIEGPDLVRWGLGRRGRTMRDLVSAPGLAAAEAVFFTRQPDFIRAASPSRPNAPPWVGPASVPAVIGVFPDGDGA